MVLELNLILMEEKENVNGRMGNLLDGYQND